MIDRPAALVFLAGLVLLLVLYRFATFAYTLSDTGLVSRWWILGIMPLGSRVLRWEDIRGARPFSFREDVLGGYVFGNILRTGKVTLLLKRRRLATGFSTRMFVTPEDPSRFIDQVNQRVRGPARPTARA